MATIIIGIGNEYRSDDSAGILLARSLREKCPADVQVIEASGEGASLMESWQGYSTVILMDAVSSGSEPGVVHRFNAHETKLPAQYFTHSTHAFSVAEAVKMARVLGRLPERLIVYGIEGKRFAPGTELSVEVESALSQVVQRVLQEL